MRQRPVVGSSEPPRLATLVEVPADAGRPARSCRDASEYFASTPLADREYWYGAHLRVLEERPLCAGADERTEVYRLTWLPSFDPSVVVDIERDSDTYRITAKIESGAGGYQPGHLASDTSYALTDAEVREFARLLSAARYWALPTEPPPNGMMGLDGSQWVLEGVSGGRYHVVDRWSPKREGPDAAYCRLGE